ncbi:MAG: DNA primase [Candidatus Roizmanbacteria bacterium]
MASKEVIDRIRETIDIVDVVGSVVTLKKMGKYFKSPCPFHQEKTPSFVVSPERQRWHCFGACHEGGDVFSFVMKYHNLTFPEAILELGKQAGIAPAELSSTISSTDSDTLNKKSILEINEFAAKYYHYILTQTPVGLVAQTYLSNRQVKDGIKETFMLGYAPDSWDNLVQYLRKKKFSDSALLATGLFVEGQRGLYDRFRGRLMFPIYNAQNDIIGFSGRLIKPSGDGVEAAKYVNTPETLVYHKRESLYGIQKAKDAIRKSGIVIVVEGEFDMIMPYSHGIENIVAIKGSAFTDEQLKILRRYCQKMIFALDADAAGIEAIKKTAISAEKYEFEMYVCRIPGGKDPDEAVRHDFPAFKQALSDVVTIYDHIIDLQSKSLNLSDPFSKNAFAEVVIPYIEPIQNPIVKQHYIKKIAQIMDVGIENVNSVIQAIRKKRKTPRPAPVDLLDQPAVLGSRRELLQRFILASLVTNDDPRSLILITTKYLLSTDFTQISYGRLYEFLIEHINQSSPSSVKEEVVPSHLKEAYHEVYLYASMISADVDLKSFEKTVIEFAKIATTDSLKTAVTEEESGHEDDSVNSQKRLATLEKALHL